MGFWMKVTLMNLINLGLHGQSWGREVANIYIVLCKYTKILYCIIIFLFFFIYCNSKLDEY